jgi:hypothetical protein
VLCRGQGGKNFADHSSHDFTSMEKGSMGVTSIEGGIGSGSFDEDFEWDCDLEIEGTG